jgi:predicted nucleic acid-binding protein
LTDEETKVESIVLYLLKRLNLKIPSDNPSVKDWNYVIIFNIFLGALNIANQTKLRTNDTVHIVYVKKFKDLGLVKCFATLDEDIISKKAKLKKSRI